MCPGGHTLPTFAARPLSGRFGGGGGALAKVFFGQSSLANTALASLLRPVFFGQSSLASLLEPVFFGQSSVASVLWPVFFGQYRFGQTSLASTASASLLCPVRFCQRDQGLVLAPGPKRSWAPAERSLLAKSAYHSNILQQERDPTTRDRSDNVTNSKREEKDEMTREDGD
jgi:hypothetical protein